MISYYWHDENKNHLVKTGKFKPGVWINVETPTTEEKEYLVKKFSLDTGHIEDVLDENEVPRLEMDGHILYLFLRFPRIEDITTVTLPLLIVMHKDCIFSISQLSPLFIKKLAEKKTNFIKMSKEKILIFLLNEMTNLYYHYLNQINKEIRQIRGTIEKIENKNIVQFVGFEEILNDFRPSLLGTDNVVSKIRSIESLVFDKQDIENLNDIHLSNRQIIESCEDTLKSIKNIREAYTTILTNNLNRVIKLFTSLTIILTIPTIISGLYGMNVVLPFATNHNAFVGIIVFTILIIAALLYVFQKNDWL